MNEVAQCVLLCVGISLAFATASLALRSLCAYQMSDDQRGFLSSVVGFISTIFAFVLGFLLVNLWTTYNGAESITQKEANNLRSIYRLVQVLPKPEKIVQAIDSYAVSVSQDEWPTMTQNHFSPITDARKDLLWEECLKEASIPSTNPIITEKMLAALIDFGNSRRERISLLQSSLHPLLLTALIITGSLTWIGFVLLGSGSKRFLFFTDLIIAAAITVNIYLLQALDRPFSGDGFSVSDSEFRELTERIKTH